MLHRDNKASSNMINFLKALKDAAIFFKRPKAELEQRDSSSTKL